MTTGTNFDGTAGPELRLGEVLGALSHALDMTEGQPKGHCIRCAWIGMQVAKALDLPPQMRTDLYFTLLMKDTGCSSNAARINELYMMDDLAFKRTFKRVKGCREGMPFVLRSTARGASPLTRLKTLRHVIGHRDEIGQELVRNRCGRGAEIARRMRFSEEVAEAIASLDEHWDGGGRPLGQQGDQIPLLSRIALMAQVTDVFTLDFGAEAAAREMENRAGVWFDPDLVRVFTSLIRDPGFAHDLLSPELEQQVFSCAHALHTAEVNEDYLDEISHAFSLVIDAKSPFTHGHSQRVARYTRMICEQLGLATCHTRWMTRAALLHDIGKLGISNTILDKPGKLTMDEMDIVRKHPVWGYDVLSRVGAFRRMAEVIVAHHERPDGKGYPYGLQGEALTRDMRIMAVADVFDALTADRPYRDAMPLEEAYKIMDKMSGTGIDPDCYAALQDAITASGWPATSLQGDCEWDSLAQVSTKSGQQSA
ncbi:HD-GYP domain-containing protein [Phaeobacter gallaeciensis]|uniref:HD-GYP domain-containing protein n=1 Tax=Phaeobacter gallaeciensis TaxID=60890 RepID=UPI00237F9570|nr:HD domain-containing protein [Phaeobacter gallaeciensis]MDE4096067.1 HD domain-containing protein [Phaeobacter gallaeciensis]MDE4104878.1 HD domain-containing protein [Phaeobacter gallaeciensis]MDE4109334.1 HD domain-containing protein [Phaeobacter gallaeciensis]MDE4113802.1 HD domain-containing protein [Phaeobacter gallaeciensis]MDE4118269.1 HD domain-containing protein [Phaeobacter gallaeciensis]